VVGCKERVIIASYRSCIIACDIYSMDHVTGQQQ